MKKAQILSAIALAFALGVVAPIAGFVDGGANAATTRIADVDKMSAADLTAALNKVSGQPAYKAYEALDIALKNTDYADVNEATEISTLTPLIAGVKTGYTTTSTSLAAVMYDATHVDNYDEYAALYKAITAKEPTIAAIKNAVDTLNTKLATADQFDWAEEITDKNIDNVQGVISAVTNATTGVKNYEAYSKLVAGVVAAQAKIDNETTGLGALQDAYKTLINLGLSDAKVSAVEDENVTIAQLKGTTFTNSVKRLTNWQTLIATVNADIKADKTNEINNATLFDTLESQVAAAYGNADLTIADLPGVTPTDPVTPGNPDDDNKDDNEGGKGDGATTPDTGVIANSEATATSTASIMAGIATALTAAGVGVVAFRNIRRNKKA